MITYCSNIKAIPSSIYKEYLTNRSYSVLFLILKDAETYTQNMQGVYRIYLHARNRPFWKCPVPDSKDSVDVAVLRMHCVLSVSDLQPLRAISIVSYTWYSDYMHVLYRYV